MSDFHTTTVTEDRVLELLAQVITDRSRNPGAKIADCVDHTLIGETHDLTPEQVKYLKNELFHRVRSMTCSIGGKRGARTRKENKVPVQDPQMLLCLK